MARLATQPQLLDSTLTAPAATELEEGLRQRIVGQGESIRQILNVYQTYLANMQAPGRPIGNFLFLGPTGTGKTRVVEAAAETLVGDARAVIKIDCAEFQHSHEIAKLIGSPPGYLGHRETHPLLSQEALNQHHTEDIKISFVLFDEIEKASDALWNLLLGVLDKASLTLGDNRLVDFSQALIFMTSNLGAAEMDSLMSPGMGFSFRPAAPVTGPDSSIGKRIKSAGVNAARRKFTPEFINRLDKIVVFNPLGQDELRRVLDLELKRVQQRVFDGTPFLFRLSDEAKGHLLVEGSDSKYGARHLKRAIERSLVYPMSNLIATGQVALGDLVAVDFDANAEAMTFEKIDEDLPVQTMFHVAGIEPSADMGVRGASAAFERLMPETALSR